MTEQLGKYTGWFSTRGDPLDVCDVQEFSVVGQQITLLSQHNTHFTHLLSLSLLAASLLYNAASVSGGWYADLSPSPSVGLSVRKVYCGETADWIWMPFGVVSGVGRGWMRYTGVATRLFPNYFEEDLSSQRADISQ